MDALQCSRRTCPLFRQLQAPAETRAGVPTCSQCGGALSARSAPAPAVPGELARRTAISLGALLAATFCGWALLPGLNPELVDLYVLHDRRPEIIPFLSIFALALYPFVSAFVTGRLETIVMDFTLFE